MFWNSKQSINSGPLLNKKQFACFQHTMGQSVPSHSTREGWGLGEERLNQRQIIRIRIPSRAHTSPEAPCSSNRASVSKGLGFLFPSSLLASYLWSLSLSQSVCLSLCLSLPLFLSAPSVQYFVTDISWTWHLQHLGVSIISQALLLHLYIVAPQGLPSEPLWPWHVLAHLRVSLKLHRKNP